MTGTDRVRNVFMGRPVDRPPMMPIVHTALAAYAGVPLGRYFSDAEAMADVLVRGWERFGFDGVQMSLGVTAEPQALGARVEQPDDGGPMLREHLLADPRRLAELRGLDPAAGGRLPMYHDAVGRVCQHLAGRAFVLSTLRGPLNIASQLRGVEDILVDMLQQPEVADRILDFATDVAIRVAEAATSSGADAVIFGEATCSPNFISPALYRRLMLPRHRRLVTAARAAGWAWVGLHVCGDIARIMEDLIATGVDLLDVDHQVPADKAIALAEGRVSLRGNLDPIGTFFNGTPEKVRIQTAALCRGVAGARWIVGSGCDIPPGTKPQVLEAFADAARRQV